MPSMATGQLNCPVRFAIIGDRTGGAVPGIYEQIVDEIERMKPDFVITVGDMIEGPETNEARIRAKWDEYLSIVSRLTMPIYYTPGNNDIESDFMEKYYLEYIGPPYYSFNYGNLHFIILDNSRWSSSDELPGEQINWLIGDLKAFANARHTFVFYHKPFFDNTTVEGKPDTLHSLFKAYGVDAVFAGHYHAYLSGKYDGILYTDVGSSGGSMSEPGPTGLTYNFTWVTVDSNGISIAPIKIGAVLPWDEVTAEENKFIYPAQTNSVSYARPFLIDQSGTVRDSVFEINIKNFSLNLFLDDTVTWSVPSGWNIKPKSMPIKIDTNSTAPFLFDISCDGTIYPVPQLSFKFPYAPGKKARARSQLPVARVTTAYVARQKPVIDGRIDEPAWHDPVTNLISYEGKQIIADPTRFYFSHDNDNIYLAAYCSESSMDSLLAEVTEHDGAVYGDDCIGFILQPALDKAEMYVIYFNPIGTAFDQKITFKDGPYYDDDPAWNCINDTKISMGKDFWSIEISMPISQFGVNIEKGTEWGLNMRRKQPRMNEAAHWQIPWHYGEDYLGRLIIQ